MIKFINDINLKKQADELGIKLWQTPGFLFIIFGIVTVIIMTAVYFISKNYNDPQILIIVESLVVSVVMIIGTTIVRFVDQIVTLNKMKSDFVSVASHQLRTPLSAIKWETELLLSKLKKGLNKKQLDNINNISSLNQKMIKMVSDLLDVARIEQERLIISKKSFDFVESTREVVKDLLPLIKERNIEIIWNVKKNLPLVFGDIEKIKLVIQNLVNNSIKYTTSNGKIEIKIFRKKEFLIFEVKDNGVGIPEEQTKHIFEKFFRSDNAAKYQTEGTGLGLFIAKNIVELLGGKIWFQSIENVGSVFSFSLPLAKSVKILKK